MKSTPAPMVTPSKALKKVLTEQRRKERDALRKRKQASYRKDVEAAHKSSAMISPSLTDEEVRDNATSKYREILMRRLNNDLAAAVATEAPLRKASPGITVAGVHVPPNPDAKTGMDMVAYTDFRNIVIKVSFDSMPHHDDPSEVTHEFLTMMRGVFHHEAGHILYSTPLLDMGRAFDDLVRDGKHSALEARLAKYIGPLDLTKDPVQAVQRYRKIHSMWNVLEDQRMESARVRDFPACQRYFEGLIYDMLTKDRDNEFWAQSWLLLAGREYLPMDVWDLSRKLIMEGLDADEWLATVRAYKSAETTEAMVEAIVDALEMVEDLDLPEGDAQSSDGGEGGEGKGDNMGGMDEGDEHATGDGHGASGDPSEGASTPGDGSEGSAPKKDPETLSAGQGTGGEHFTTSDFQDAIRKMKPGRDIKDSEMVKQTIDETNNLGLPEYRGGVTPMTPDQSAAAMSLASGIERALESYVTAATPTWVHRQEEGFIDPCAYRTREAGDLDYNIHLSGEVGQKLDLHVSVAADVSYSMSRHMSQMSVMLLGMKMACDNLGVPNNFSIWSDAPENWAIYGDGEEHVVFPALGGTNPTEALTDAIAKNEEKRPQHLVLIFTDGEWYGLDSVEPWRTSLEQQFIIVKYGQGPREVHGADAIVDLRELSGFPRMLEDALDGMLAKVV